MAAYFDSSLILAAVFGEISANDFDLIWGDQPLRVSSLLLEAECLVAIRRVAARESKGQAFIRAPMRLSAEYLAAITLRDLDATVVEKLKQREELAQCRTLDAVHLATALIFQEHLDDRLTICSLDSRMCHVAVQLGFPVLPKRPGTRQ